MLKRPVLRKGGAIEAEFKPGNHQRARAGPSLITSARMSCPSKALERKRLNLSPLEFHRGLGVIGVAAVPGPPGKMLLKLRRLSSPKAAAGCGRIWPQGVSMSLPVSPDPAYFFLKPRLGAGTAQSLPAWAGQHHQQPRASSRQRARKQGAVSPSSAPPQLKSDQ